MMRPTIPPIAAAALFFTASALAENVTTRDRFELWNDCKPMRLVVEDLHEDAAEIGLTEAAIETAVRSRLRAARLYHDKPGAYLYVNVNVVGNEVSNAFSTEIEYRKRMMDFASGEAGTASGWSVGSTGISGGSGFILSSVSQRTDKFIDEYLRVNADACTR